VAADDKEKEGNENLEEEEKASSSPSSSPPPSSPPPSEPPAPAKLPPRVERALAKARAVAQKDRAQKGGRWLAIFPTLLALALMLLMMPRATEPDSIPLPRVDERALRKTARADDDRARAVSMERLPSDVRNVGTAFRALNTAEAHNADDAELINAQREISVALRDLNPGTDIDENLLSLRAFQMQRFLEGVRHWENTGETTEELTALGGNFINRTAEAGWASNQAGGPRHLLMNDTQRRVAFKTMWNALVGVDRRPAFVLTIDEQKSLYAFYFQYPHPQDSRRVALRVQRRDALTPEACLKANVEERRQAELWRVEKVRKFASIDPSYPATYAMGVGYYKAGRFDLASEAFTTFIGAHPDGPYALRAKNYLKASLTAK
jgi:TolA-binding protein